MLVEERKKLWWLAIACAGCCGLLLILLASIPKKLAGVRLIAVQHSLPFVSPIWSMMALHLWALAAVASAVTNETLLQLPSLGVVRGVLLGSNSRAW